MLCHDGFPCMKKGEFQLPNSLRTDIKCGRRRLRKPIGDTEDEREEEEEKGTYAVCNPYLWRASNIQRDMLENIFIIHYTIRS